MAVWEGVRNLSPAQGLEQLNRRKLPQEPARNGNARQTQTPFQQTGNTNILNCLKGSFLECNITITQTIRVNKRNKLSSTLYAYGKKYYAVHIGDTIVDWR